MVELIWDNKQEMLVEINSEAFQQTDKKLIPCIEESKNFDNTDNLYIEGDNLDALKLLKKNYENKIKMIYIDPPYNTEKKFMYNDTFRNKKKKECRHSGWLNMMYPRLRLARDLLTDDGVIFVSIGEEEVDNIIKMLNEVFGEANCVSKITRVAKTASNMGKFFSPSIDYLLCYAKNLKNTSPFKGEVDEALYKKVESSGEREGELYRDDVAFFQSGLKHGGSRYPIKCPDGEWVNTPDDKPWRASEETFLSWVSKNMIVFKETKTSPLINEETGEKANWNIYTKSYLDDRKETGTQPRNILTDFINRKGADLIKQYGIPFDFAKPVELLYFLIKIINDNGSLIMDFFSGSGTTAHAVMQLNAEDNGNRKYIMVQLPEATDEKSEAYKAGYKNICEIGKERIRRASKKIHEDKPDAVFDDGFKVYKIK